MTDRVDLIAGILARVHEHEGRMIVLPRVFCNEIAAEIDRALPQYEQVGVWCDDCESVWPMGSAHAIPPAKPVLREVGEPT